MEGVPATYALSPSDAADFLGVHEATVKRWAKSGKLRGIRTPGGWWKFSEADLESFLANLANDRALPEAAGQ